MTVSTNDRRITYSPVAGTTALPYDFLIFDDDEIEVTLTRASATTTLTKTTDYTVSGVGSVSGGTVTLVNASQASDVYVINGDTTVERASDFQQRGEWNAEDINEQFDRLVMMLQEFIRDYSTFVIRWSPSFTGTTGTVDPGITANQVLARNSSNTGWVGTTITAGGSVQSASETVAGIAELATQAEAEAALNDTTIMTPLKVSQQITARQTSTDAGAGVGPDLTLDRNSATPAASDLLGRLKLRGRDSGGNATDFASVYGKVLDPTNGSEDGAAIISALIAGTDTAIVTAGPGVQIGAPTGADKGAGTINVDTGIYIDGQPVGNTVAFRAHKNGSNQGSMTSTGLIQITFGTEAFDQGGYFASNAWTPPAGRYQIHAAVLWTSANGVDNEVLSISLLKNAGEEAFAQNNRNGTGAQQVCLSAIVEANGTDAFRLYGTKGGAGDGTVDGTATRTYFSGCAL